MLIDARTNETDVVYEGNNDEPFFTDIMGKHEWLYNGNLMIAESRAGRAFEVTGKGELVWEYYNVAEEGILGLIDEAYRLPPHMNRAMFDELARDCRTR